MSRWSPSGVLRRNAVTVLGEGPEPRRDAAPDVDRASAWMLMAHGFGTDQTMWRRLVPQLPAHVAVVLMDHVGAGSSDLGAYQPHRYHSLAGYADDLVEVVEELSEVFGAAPHYVGHSAGGMIGALGAVARPELFSSLTMVGASPRYVDAPGYVGGMTREAVDDLLMSMEDNYAGFAHTLAPLAMANADRPELAEELANSFLRVKADIALDFARTVFLSDFREDVRRVSVPTLIVQAAADPMVPPEVATFLHDAIPGSRVEQLAATGHFPHMSGPDETARVLSAFVTDVPPRTLATGPRR